MWRGLALSLTAGALSVACTPAAKPTLLKSTPYDVSRIVGEWHGEYKNAETGLQGSMMFVLESVRGPAYGEVVMTPREPAPTDRPGSTMGTVQLPTRRTLTVTLVKVERSSIQGTLEPYIDSGCACLLWTTFTGQLSGRDGVEGTFSTTGPNGQPQQSGVWMATRIKRASYDDGGL